MSAKNSTAETRWIEDVQNACPACGGSGHKDDAAQIIKLLREAHAAMRATGWHDAQNHIRPGTDGILEAAVADIEARLGNFLSSKE